MWGPCWGHKRAKVFNFKERGGCKTSPLTQRVTTSGYHDGLVVFGPECVVGVVTKDQSWLLWLLKWFAGQETWLWVGFKG